MSTAILNLEKPFGLFELDETGVVLYSRVEVESAKEGPRQDLTGTNFFNLVAQFGNGDEISSNIMNFACGSKVADSFRSTFRLEAGSLTVKVLLARIRERSNGARTKSVLV